MSTREERVRVFTDTQSWIETDDELSAAVNYSKKHTKIYWEDDYPKFNRSKKLFAKVTVTKDRSFQAAMRLLEENEGLQGGDRRVPQGV